MDIDKMLDTAAVNSQNTSLIDDKPTRASLLHAIHLWLSEVDSGDIDLALFELRSHQDFAG